MKIPQPSRVRTRVRIATLSLVLLSTIAVTVSALHFVKVGMQTAILQEQAGRVADIATDIDDRLSSRKILLRTLAAALLTLPGDDPQQNLQAFSAVTAAFDNVSVISSAGDVIANLRGSAPVGKLNVADRAYFTETLSSRKGVISEPLRNRFSGKPQIIITEPMSNMDGTAAKVLAGSIDLQENSFLGGLGGTRFGASGYLFIVNNNALVIHHLGPW